jgi:hypothetical protein
LKPRFGLVWDQPLVFGRFLEDCDVTSIPVTPHLLAAPFFRGQYHVLIIPTGFANPAYSKVLPALKACSDRICRFVENGGTLVVYGAADPQPDRYSWLPFRVVYHYEPGNGRIEVEPGNPFSSIISDYDPDHIEYDGFFSSFECNNIGTIDGKAVLLEKNLGKGVIIVTSIHEYPSRSFINGLCMKAGETFF